MRVNEPQVENSGIPQGVLISRQKIPKSSSEFYTPKDFNIGINVQLYAKTIRIVDCDEFTRVIINSLYIIIFLKIIICNYILKNEKLIKMSSKMSLMYFFNNKEILSRSRKYRIKPSRTNA